MEDNIKSNDNIILDYKTKDILLSKNDFNNIKELQISPHIIRGSYKTYSYYLNTMFYLEYEDCYRALKQAMNELKLKNKSINFMDDNELHKFNKDMKDLYFYLNGEIKGIDVNRDGIIIFLKFASLQRKISTRKLKYGSLIILTDNNFTNYAFATVFSNEVKSLEYPYYGILLSLLNMNKETILFLVNNRYNLQIYESKAYFESYIHVMKRLKEMDVRYLPFKEELIDGNFKSSNQYCLKNQGSLDNSQLIAINKSLSNNISLIQGPPGTGKTYVGIKLVQLFLQLYPYSQILIVSYTNHALDSFLEGIIEFTDDVVRIGGRCNNEKIQKYILNS